MHTPLTLTVWICVAFLVKLVFSRVSGLSDPLVSVHSSPPDVLRSLRACVRETDEESLMDWGWCEQESVWVCVCLCVSQVWGQLIHLHLDLDHLPLPSIMLKLWPPEVRRQVHGAARSQPRALLQECAVCVCVCACVFHCACIKCWPAHRHFISKYISDRTSKVSLAVCSRCVEWPQSWEWATRRIEKGASYNMWEEKAGAPPQSILHDPGKASFVFSFAPHSCSRPALICARRSLSHLRYEDRVSRASLLWKCSSWGSIKRCKGMDFRHHLRAVLRQHANNGHTETQLYAAA